MPNINIPTFLDARIQPHKFARNRRVVSTSVERYMRRLANQIRAYEGKELFSCMASLPAIASYTGGARTRWRFRQKLSPHVRKVHLFMRMALQDPAAASTDPRVTFELFNSSDISIGSYVHHFGLNAVGDHTDTPDTWTYVHKTIDVGSAGIELYGTFTEHDRARLISALVYEEAPEHTKAGGYIIGTPAQGANIYAADREVLASFVNAMWLGGGAVVLNLNCNDDGSAFNYVEVGAGVNVIDQTSTAVSASSPGFFFDGTGKALEQNAGEVPVTMWVFGQASTDGDAFVKVYDSGGSVVGQVGIDSAEAWHSTSFTLPATEAKYDIHASTATGEEINVKAISIYEDG